MTFLWRAALAIGIVLIVAAGAIVLITGSAFAFWALIVAAVIAFIVAIFARSVAKAHASAADNSAKLKALADLHRAGTLTDEEFRRAKAQLLS